MTPSAPIDGNGIVDPEEEPAKSGGLYNAREKAPNMIFGFSQPIANSGYTEDKWGTFWSGYTPIVDPNVASRLEHLSREYPARILASQAATDSLQSTLKLESIGPIELKGRREPILVYQVLS